MENIIKRNQYTLVDIIKWVVVDSIWFIVGDSARSEKKKILWSLVDIIK